MTEPDDVAPLTIRALASKYNVSLRTLRFYEERGILHPSRIRSERFYTDEDETRLRLAIVGRRIGFSLKEILELIEQQQTSSCRLRDNLGSLLQPTEIERRLEVLEQRKLSLDAAIAELRCRIGDGCPIGDE